MGKEDGMIGCKITQRTKNEILLLKNIHYYV